MCEEQHVFAKFENAHGPLTNRRLIGHEILCPIRIESAHNKRVARKITFVDHQKTGARRLTAGDERTWRARRGDKSLRMRRLKRA